MNPQWEYLRVVWEYRRNRVPDGRRATGGARSRWSYDSVFSISRPGTTVPDTWQQQSSKEADPAPDPRAVSEMLNSLGSEGWELAGQSVLATTIEPDGDTDVPFTAGPVIVLGWTFKRRKAA